MLMGFDGSCAATIEDPFKFTTPGGTTTVQKQPQILSDGAFGLMGYFSRVRPVMVTDGAGGANAPVVPLSNAENPDELSGADVVLDLRITPVNKPAK
jgi:hypothetical protein